MGVLNATPAAFFTELVRWTSAASSEGCRYT
jgi:hypothetical protein